jgi:RNA polymerase primary sigma factor
MNFNEKKNKFIVIDRTLDDYLKEINGYKILSPKEERALVELAKSGDDNARQKLVASNLRFVYSVVKNYANDDNIKDLISEGNKGLMCAIDSYDPSKDTRFLSYAIWTIKREVYAYLNGENHLIRKTNNTKTVYKIKNIKQKFFAEHGRYPDVDEIAEILESEYGFKTKDKTDLLDVTTTSINTCYDDEDSKAFENSEYFTEKTAVGNDYENEIDRDHTSAVSSALISCLSDREQTVIKMAFGLAPYNKEYTNAEIGEEIGMTAERARQLKNGAIEKMRKLAVAEHFTY